MNLELPQSHNIATRGSFEPLFAAPLLHDRAGRLAAVDHQLRPRAVGALAAGEEERRVGHLAHRADALQDDVLDLERLSRRAAAAVQQRQRLRGGATHLPLLVGPAVRGALLCGYGRLDGPGAHAVAANVVLGEICTHPQQGQCRIAHKEACVFTTAPTVSAVARKLHDGALHAATAGSREG